MDRLEEEEKARQREYRKIIHDEKWNLTPLMRAACQGSVYSLTHSTMCVLTHSFICLLILDDVTNLVKMLAIDSVSSSLFVKDSQGRTALGTTYLLTYSLTHLLNHSLTH